MTNLFEDAPTTPAPPAKGRNFMEERATAQQLAPPPPDPERRDYHDVVPVPFELFRRLFEANSCDRICNGEPLRDVVPVGGRLYGAAGSSSGGNHLPRIDAYELVPREHWTERICGYAEKFAYADLYGDQYRSYHRLLVRSKGRRYVLKGPAIHFVPDLATVPPTDHPRGMDALLYNWDHAWDKALAAMGRTPAPTTSLFGEEDEPEEDDDCLLGDDDADDDADDD